jgi:hypothetical protein
MWDGLKGVMVAQVVPVKGPIDGCYGFAWGDSAGCIGAQVLPVKVA